MHLHINLENEVVPAILCLSMLFIKLLSWARFFLANSHKFGSKFFLWYIYFAEVIYYNLLIKRLLSLLWLSKYEIYPSYFHYYLKRHYFSRRNPSFKRKRLKQRSLTKTNSWVFFALKASFHHHWYMAFLYNALVSLVLIGTFGTHWYSV